jgi:hypothetical protein
MPPVLFPGAGLLLIPVMLLMGAWAVWQVKVKRDRFQRAMAEWFAAVVVFLAAVVSLVLVGGWIRGDVPFPAALIGLATLGAALGFARWAHARPGTEPLVRIGYRWLSLGLRPIGRVMRPIRRSSVLLEWQREPLGPLGPPPATLGGLSRRPGANIVCVGPPQELLRVRVAEQLGMRQASVGWVQSCDAAEELISSGEFVDAFVVSSEVPDGDALPMAMFIERVRPGVLLVWVRIESWPREAVLEGLNGPHVHWVMEGRGVLSGSVA